MTLVIPGAYENASDRAPFSNGTMWDLWSDQWCYRCRFDGIGIGEDEPHCPLILVALNGRTPAEWTDRNPPLGDYRCSKFSDRGDPAPPEPTPEIPGQLALFGREPFERRPEVAA